MNKEEQRNAFEGLAIIIENELEQFDDNQSIEEAAKRKEKISNLLIYAKQTGYCGLDGCTLLHLEHKYANRLSEIKEKLLGVS